MIAERKVAGNMSRLVEDYVCFDWIMEEGIRPGASAVADNGRRRRRNRAGGKEKDARQLKSGRGAERNAVAVTCEDLRGHVKCSVR